MNLKLAILTLMAVGGLTPRPVEVIHSRWGTTTHRPNALLRAMLIQESHASEMLRESVAKGQQGNVSQRLANRQEASRATIRLPEVISISITKTADDGHDFVINLVDIDGNRSSIWCRGNKIDEQLQVTGVEPY